MRFFKEALLIGCAILLTSRIAFAQDVKNYSPSNPVDQFVFKVFDRMSLLREMSSTDQETMDFMFGKPTKVTNQVKLIQDQGEQFAIQYVIRTLEYPGLSLILRIGPNSSASIQGLKITSSHYELAGGLKIGDTITEFKRVLGKAQVQQSLDNADEYVIQDEVLLDIDKYVSQDMAYVVTLKINKSGHVISAEWKAIEVSD